jgi:hypothetical protein
MKKDSMSKWTKWIDITDKDKLKQELQNKYGIYEIRIVNSNGSPIKIMRLANKIDSIGLLYIGRSGYRRQMTNRTLFKRIGEFSKQQHSGGITYDKANEILQYNRTFRNHYLQVRVMFLSDKKINAAESRELRLYFEKFAELPPCNSSIPKEIKIRDRNG